MGSGRLRSRAPGRILVRRYRLEALLGAGAHGEVWVAQDQVLRAQVAIKWMKSAARAVAPQARREIAVLRLLRFPGVVRLLDEGIEDGSAFFVMDRVHGAPFPGLPAAASPSWEALAQPALALLEVLSHVHAAGVVHRDLKPENILVDEKGFPTVLDFGISARAEAPSARRAPGAERPHPGTPAYLAPEQILSPSGDARSDLYAVGVLLHESFTGRVPHEEEDARAMLRARLRAAPPPLRESAPLVPAHVARTVDRLLALRPDDRYGTAREVIAALRGEPSAADPFGLLRALSAGRDRGARRGRAAETRALLPLFSGPDRLFHAAEDAAAALRDRASGGPARMEEELRRWLLLGIARRDGAKVAVDPAWLPRLRPRRQGPSGGEERLFRLLAAGDHREAVREAVRLGRRHRRSGALELGALALSEGLTMARAWTGRDDQHPIDEGLAGETRLLSEYTKIAFAEGTPYALDRALYELSRSSVRSEIIERLEVLLRAGLAVQGAGERALRLCAALPPFADRELEWRRRRVQIMACASAGATRKLGRLVAEIEGWAASSESPWARLSLAEALARQRYLQGRYEECAAAYLQAAAWEPSRIGRIAAVLNSASALIEAFRFQEAAERAEAGKRLAEQCRNPYWEGRGEWIGRAARYRAGEALTPDIELVEAVTLIGAEELEALVCSTEAAIAFRCGRADVAAELSRRAARLWAKMGRDGAALLSECLALACSPGGGPAPERAFLAPYVERAVRCPIPGIGLQALGLLGARWPEARRGWRPLLERLAAGVPKEYSQSRMDVLSADECLRAALSA